MQKTICGKLYDTETATRIKSKSVGTFGDPAGYEEILFMTPEGNYFLYGAGGKDSVYATPKLTRVSKQKAEAWQKEN
jgi:hypothetical protein